ncbi:T9SS type A sorting domain-containing protein [Psychroflexus montanilacus]|uniref:T9SS type A sorting domain-containing protein n=1 Tax=Psychroflexus montanilacus TaxID=2873598 RepID=UPI001CCEC5C1|nr:T9SS type A sorting domain-containing protein [Psychroflexus montanilacus]MBZ9652359.1 T9SS type A sorting domain-containing protein [Psychroflexus montanilacus]
MILSPISTGIIQINDFTGIQDFTQLEVLNLNNTSFNFYGDDSKADFLNSNLNLREIYITNDAADVPEISLESLNLSNLQNLEYLDLTNVDIKSIFLNNPEFNYENITLELNFEGFPRGQNDWPVCIGVNDPDAASSGSFPYDTWNILAGGVRTFSFSATCNLSAEDFESMNEVSIFPNPIQDVLHFINPNKIKIEQIEVYSISGKLVKSFKEVGGNIYLENLTSGVYFVNLISQDQKAKSYKIIKQ